ncbi:uncharacterized protein LOC123559098 [Mercenaria mercenaria]|uniref:uncharacterized protein LOC123559098 n=1 Tax=Mercenaria mercenaria TaxID=6596 RepID=UPI00234E8E44|nr:uncharacterized protein LOC123559098 [Mercenaria mercenaria]
MPFPCLLYIRFEGNAWIGELHVGASGRWKLTVEANLDIREDKDIINSSPTAEIMPIIRLQYGCSHIIKIPVQDPDNDVVRCRLAKGEEECGDVCSGFPNSHLDNDACTIYYEAKYKLGWYAVALQVEDFMDINSTTPFSSIPVQFLVHIYNSTESCMKTTVFIEPTPKEDACIGVPHDQIYSSSIVARVLSANQRSESEKRCIKLLAGVSPPHFVNGSQYPLGNIYSNESNWVIRADSDFVQASRPSFISLYNSKGVLIERINASDPKALTLDTGRVLKGTSYCGAESAAIDDPFFWRVRIRDVTPPHITLTAKSDKTNATADFEWTVNEIVNTTCTLTYPYGTSKTFVCDQRWTGTDLQEGQYCLMINATDLEGNSALVTHNWSVDLTPPGITFLKTPSKLSNETIVSFKWACTNPCYTSCFVDEQHQSLDCSGRQLTWNIPLTSNVAYNLNLEAVDEVWNKAVINYTWTTDFSPPEVEFCENGQRMTVDCTSDFSPEVICNVTVKDNMDLSPQLVYSDTNAGPCAFDRTWTATDNAGNLNKYVQNVHIKSAKPMHITHYPGPVSVACGALDEMTDILKSMIEVKHPCNLDVNITFKDNASERCDLLIKRSWTISDNCGNNIKFYQFLKIRQAEVPLAPENGQTGVELNPFLRWQQASSRIRYEIYLWERDATRPKSSEFTSVNNHCQAKSLKPGTMYRWQVVFKYGYNESNLSPVWVFETRDFADLSVKSIIVPQSGFTDQFCTIEWTVINTGGIATQRSHWTDAVFFSWDKNFQNAKLVATVEQRNILYQNDSYMSTARFLLEREAFGFAYVFVHTDYHNYLGELDEINNLMLSKSAIDVKLTPPPDLKVISIKLPLGRIFSGTSVMISWTIVNTGKGTTKSGHWSDRIILSPTNTLGSNTRTLLTVKHSGNLHTNENYTHTLLIPIPEFIFGQFYLLIQADIYNQVFEYLSENNTFASQTALDVLLAPPPDLDLEGIHTPQTWTTGDTVTITWTVGNKGSNSPKSQMYWQDAVRLVSKFGNHLIGSSTHFGGLAALEKYKSTLTYYVSPDTRSGEYNVTITTDFKHGLFEYNMTENNKRSTMVRVIQALPDLRVQNFTVSAVYAMNSTYINVTWVVKNVGKGMCLSSEWIDTLFVEDDDRYYSVLKYFHIKKRNRFPPDEIYTHNEIVELPFMFYGNLQFGIKIDDMYSSTGDQELQNNMYIQQNVNINLRAADLIPKSMQVTENSRGGENVSVTYTVINDGCWNVSGVKWHDNLFFTNTINGARPVYNLDTTVDISFNLNKNQSYTNTVNFTLPTEMSGTFFAVVKVNFDENIFEGNKTKNNRLIKSFNIKSAPTPDLAVTYISANTTNALSKNKMLSVEWTVKNIGNSMQTVQTWKDTVIIKRIIETESALAKMTYMITHNLETLSSYRQERQFVIPSYISGAIYVCVKTDEFSSLYEMNSMDNNIMCQRKPVFVRELSAAQLSAKIVNLTTESEKNLILPGSNIIVEYSVKNIGETPTDLSSWIDTIYMTSFKPENITEYT